MLNALPLMKKRRLPSLKIDDAVRRDRRQVRGVGVLRQRRADGERCHRRRIGRAAGLPLGGSMVASTSSGSRSPVGPES